MSRLDCLNGTQRLFIENALVHYESLFKMAKVSRVHPRTLSDWRREKTHMPLEVLERIYKDLGLSLPSSLKILPDLWYVKRAARMGGRRRFQLYGPFGTLESRRKGGIVSTRRFQNDPNYAKSVGFRLRKQIQKPRHSSLLAEFVGILLGDGCLNNYYQVTVSFNSKTDAAYAVYIQSLLKRLFGLDVAVLHRKGTHAGVLIASSRALQEYLVRKVGLKRGNKVAIQVDIPEWIWTKAAYQSACLRGLMDTDGSVYSYAHRVNGYRYRHLAMCFTNHSLPLLRSVEGLFRNHGFYPARSRYNVYLHRISDIRAYFRLVGSSNPKHKGKYLDFEQERCRSLVERDRLESG